MTLIEITPLAAIVALLIHNIILTRRNRKLKFNLKGKDNRIKGQHEQIMQLKNEVSIYESNSNDKNEAKNMMKWFAEVVEIQMRDADIEIPNNPLNEKSDTTRDITLEERLETALLNEDFEQAEFLRKAIEKRDNNTGKG